MQAGERPSGGGWLQIGYNAKTAREEGEQEKHDEDAPGLVEARV